MRLFLSFFIFGFAFGCGPCLASCGPLLLSFTFALKPNFFQLFKIYIVFSLARVLVYLIFGLSVFGLGQLVTNFFSSSALRVFYFFAGAFVVALGIAVLLGAFRHSFTCQRIGEFLFKKRLTAAGLLGLIIGSLPCAPLISFFAYAATVSQRWQEAFLNSFFFGLGTVFSPLFLLIWAGIFLQRNILKQKSIAQFFDFACAGTIIFLGVLIALKGL